LNSLPALHGVAVMPAGSKQKMVLNSSDKLFAELRDASFAAVGPRLGEKAKVIQTNYQGSKVGAVCTMLQPRACLASCSACIHLLLSDRFKMKEGTG